jgi:dihydroorotate dehydrogenase (NAD+) catalytic subunit
MWIDVGTGRPALANKVGGVSGPRSAHRVRAVYEIRKAVDLPIIGTGGVPARMTPFS